MSVSGKILQLWGKIRARVGGGRVERSIVWWPGTGGKTSEFPYRPGLSSACRPGRFQPHPGPQNPHLKEGGRDLRNVLSERPFQI